VLVAVNPGRQFAQARNTTRQSDLIQLTGAIYAFAAEHDGNLPGTSFDPVTGAPNFPVAPSCVGTDAVTPCFDLAAAGADEDGDGAVDVGTSIVPTYIAALPQDPSTGNAPTDIGYTLETANSRVTADAPGAELGAVITVTR
jgi:hypothetical protein